MSHTHALGCACCTLPMLSKLDGELFGQPDWQEQVEAQLQQIAPRSRPAEPEQPVLFQGGVIHTMAEAGNQTVAALGVADGRIVAAGTLSQVEQAMAAHPPFRRIDLQQRTLLPGFIDPHLHILPSALFSTWLQVGAFDDQDLNRDYSIEQVTQVLGKALQNPDALPKDKQGTPWVLGFGVDPSLMKVWTDPDQALLDGLSDSVPIFLFNTSGHIAYANTPAQKKAGISVPGGVLTEDKVALMLPHIPSPGLNALLQSLKKLLHHAALRGNTTVFDAGLGSAKGAIEVILLKLVANSALNPLRIGAALYSNTKALMDEWLLLFRPSLTGKDDQRFSIRALKLVADGSNQGLTGYQTHDYACACEHTVPGVGPKGLFNFKLNDQGTESSDFTQRLRQAHEHGWPVLVHANGDQAMDVVLDSYASVLESSPADTAVTPVLRHRIEHASLMTDDNIAEMARLKLSPSFLIGHVGYWGHIFQQTIFGKERAQMLDRCRSALNAGLRISFHSDHFVTPLGSLRMMQQAVTRIMEGAPDGQQQPLNADERLERLDALRAITLDAAWQCHMDHLVGSLEPGKLADLVILDQDPLNAAVDNLRQIPVHQTWLSGAVVFDQKTSVKTGG